MRDAGLKLFANPDYASNTLTAIAMPEGWSSRIVIDYLVERENVMLQAGQGAYADSVLRIGHMGWVTEDRTSGGRSMRWTRGAGYTGPASRYAPCDLRPVVNTPGKSRILVHCVFSDALVWLVSNPEATR